MVRKRLFWSALAILLVAVAGSALLVRARNRADIGAGQVRLPLEVTSSSFTSGAPIPNQLTCFGPNMSPGVAWGPAPAATKSFAVIMDDEDALFGFVHWIVYNIPSDEHSIREGASSDRGLPGMSREGLNGRGSPDYTGPCPPGKAAHHYLLRVYALGVDPPLAPGLTKRQLAAAVRNQVLAEGQVTGIFARGSH